MKGKINFLALLIGFQLLSFEAGIVIENITLIDAKNGTRTNQTVSIENGVIQSMHIHYSVSFTHLPVPRILLV